MTTDTNQDWIHFFDDLVDEGFDDLHQTAGWKGLDRDQWRALVADLLRDRVRAGDAVFEAGCGVLALLREVQRRYPGVRIYGMEPAREVMARVKQTLGEDDADNFFIGHLPEGLAAVPDATFDLTLCNSVLQYIDASALEASVREMARITKPGRHVIIGGLCDPAFESEIEAAVSKHWTGSAIDGQERLTRTYIARSWWARFDADGCRVEVHDRLMPSVANARLRYNVHIGT